MTRRSALKQAAAFLAAAKLRAAEQLPVSQVMTTLSTYMSGAADRALPANVIEATKHHILDTLAAMISGADLPPGRIALQFARAHTGERTATVAGSDIVCGPIEAALANGKAADASQSRPTRQGRKFIRRDLARAVAGTVSFRLALGR